MFSKNLYINPKKSFFFQNIYFLFYLLSKIKATIKVTNCQIEAVKNIYRTKKSLNKSIYALARNYKKTKKNKKLNTSLNENTFVKAIIPNTIVTFSVKNL